MNLTIYNSLSKQKEIFKPIHKNQVRLYVCGMTVYDFCHLGHARVMVAFDLISRYLRHLGYEVTYIRNITDIDDKIIQRANENNESYQTLTQRFIQAMHQDEQQLGILPPDGEPKASEHIDAIIQMIQTLIDKNMAYLGDNGDVYYCVRQFANYGKLSGKVLDELSAGARVEVDSSKRDPLDFVLWKAAKADEPHWQSPFGIGRPGWHIECSAMSTCCLGNHFDMHGGGPDLKFPHHENEIAQSEAATGETYANYWLHAGAVRVDGEKMSKSLGNFFTIREILNQYHPEVVRFFLLSSHYRSAINYSEQSLQDAKAKLERLYNCLELAQINHKQQPQDIQNNYSKRFHAALNDDFNSAEAIGVLFELVAQINRSQAADKPPLAQQLRYLAGIMGCLQLPPSDYLQGTNNDLTLDKSAIETLIQQRTDAKAAKDFARADAIRAELLKQGIELKDSSDGTTWRKQWTTNKT